MSTPRRMSPIGSAQRDHDSRVANAGEPTRKCEATPRGAGSRVDLVRHGAGNRSRAHMRQRWRSAVLRASLLLTLIYSTGLHMAWGPEATIRPTFFNDPPIARAHPRFPDQGSLHERPLSVLGVDAWKLGGPTRDQVEYLIQTESPADARPPFAYRFLPTTIVRAVSQLTGMGTTRAFQVVNVTCVLVAALVFMSFLRRHFAFDELLALLGGILLVTMVAVTRTVSYLMLEPASVLAMAVVVWMVAERRIAGYCIAVAAAVATKEVLTIGGLLWLSHHAQRRDLRRLARDLALAAWPLLVFAAIRLAHGGDLTSHDGSDVAAGELPNFADRIVTARGVVSLLERTALAFGVLWTGLVAVRRHPILARHAVIVAPVLLAAFLLSHQITRVIGILFPVVIPGFLLLLRDHLTIASVAEGDASKSAAALDAVVATPAAPRALRRTG
jgi:hypothetical protein